MKVSDSAKILNETCKDALQRMTWKISLDIYTFKWINRGLGICICIDHLSTSLTYIIYRKNSSHAD